MNVWQIFGMIYSITGLALIGSSLFFRDERVMFSILAFGGAATALLGLVFSVW
jgi:hypothetical protein